MKQEPCFYHGFGSKTAKNRLWYKRLLELPKTRKPLIQKGRRLLAGSGEKVTNQKKGRRKPPVKRYHEKKFFGGKTRKSMAFSGKIVPRYGNFHQNRFWPGKEDKLMQRNSLFLVIFWQRNKSETVPITLFHGFRTSIRFRRFGYTYKNV